MLTAVRPGGSVPSLPSGRLPPNPGLVPAMKIDCDPVHITAHIIGVALAPPDGVSPPTRPLVLESEMTALAKAISNAFLSTTGESDTFKQIVMFCAAGLLVSLLFLIYRLDSTGLF